MEYKPEELKTINEYERSIDPEVLEFVKGVLRGEDRLNSANRIIP